MQRINAVQAGLSRLSLLPTNQYQICLSEEQILVNLGKPKEETSLVLMVLLTSMPSLLQIVLQGKFHSIRISDYFRTGEVDNKISTDNLKATGGTFQSFSTD